MQPSILDLRHLRTLAALVEGGSLARAAERLHLTQSALSHQIKTLESHYGLSLFEREARPLKPTDAGRRLLAVAQQVMPLVWDAERDLAKLAQGAAGTLRVAVECHTCFDWLMPAMDAFRERWPEVELDLVSGFQQDAASLLARDVADVVVVHDAPAAPAANTAHYLFTYETVALLSPRHALAGKAWLEAEDFRGETLIRYPVEDDKLDVVRHVLAPAGIRPNSRSAELTVAILQLVASHRGIATLPVWALGHYAERGYVLQKRLTAQGLYCELFALTTESFGRRAYVQEFLGLIRAGK